MYEETMRNTKQPVVIGIDHGFSMMKTGAGIVFSNGIVKTEGRPPEVQGSLYYDGNYYSVGGARMTVNEDKTANDNYFILTLVAIAKELKCGMLGNNATVILGVGVPFKRYGAEHIKLKKYLMRPGILAYEFEGEEYSVQIKEVFCYPQCFAAVASRIGNMKGRYVVADIGSWTKDIVSINDGRVMVDQSVTISHSIIALFQNIIAEVDAKNGKRIPEDVIQDYILGKSVVLQPNAEEIILQNLRKFVSETEGQLNENGFDIDYSNVIYVGGGATIMQKFAPERSNVTYLTDVCLNAKGYELLAKSQIAGK